MNKLPTKIELHQANQRMAETNTELVRKLSVLENDMKLIRWEVERLLMHGAPGSLYSTTLERIRKLTGG